jgi:hypothetical protein
VLGVLQGVEEPGHLVLAEDDRECRIRPVNPVFPSASRVAKLS